MKRYYLIMFFCGLLASCEQVIDLPLRTSDQLYVLDGHFHEGDTAYMQVTLSGAFNASSFNFVEGAQIMIAGQNGESEILQELDSGRYAGRFLKGEAGKQYTIQVMHQGKTFNTAAEMPSKVTIDSLIIRDEEIVFPGQEPKKEAVIFFTDPGGVENYYRVKFYHNEEELIGFRVTDDQVFDGRQIPFNLAIEDLLPNDTVRVELIAIEQVAYDYYVGLVEILNLNPGSGVPYNPINNWSPEALGNFTLGNIDSTGVIFRGD
ncbi:DUF4249 family protein [Persicobacter diffluens]|uniref:DUF4249 domain-containing protein n=1 Tax=Persicobacter diffluens TaxID=981 RepID=A0AAN5AKQ4_9BACT|nr:hypothetical protein PEDI_12230 [Persicobacter diffluens]